MRQKRSESAGKRRIALNRSAIVNYTGLQTQLNLDPAQATINIMPENSEWYNLMQNTLAERRKRRAEAGSKRDPSAYQQLYR